MAREPKRAQSKPVKAPSKLDQIEALLRTGTGATITELMDAAALDTRRAGWGHPEARSGQRRRS